MLALVRVLWGEWCDVVTMWGWAREGAVYFPGEGFGPNAWMLWCARFGVKTAERLVHDLSVLVHQRRVAEEGVVYGDGRSWRDGVWLEAMDELRVAFERGLTGFLRVTLDDLATSRWEGMGPEQYLEPPPGMAGVTGDMQEYASVVAREPAIPRTIALCVPSTWEGSAPGGCVFAPGRALRLCMRFQRGRYMNLQPPLCMDWRMEEVWPAPDGQCMYDRPRSPSRLALPGERYIEEVD